MLTTIMVSCVLVLLLCTVNAAIRVPLPSLSGTVNWNDATTWTGSLVPTSSDEVDTTGVPSGVIITLPATLTTISKLTLNSATTLSGTSAATLSVGSIVWNSGTIDGGVLVKITSTGSVFSKGSNAAKLSNSNLEVSGSVTLSDKDGLFELDTAGTSSIKITSTGRITLTSPQSLGVNLGLYIGDADCTLENSGTLELISSKPTGTNYINQKYIQNAGATMLVTGNFAIGGQPYTTVQKIPTSTYSGTITLNPTAKLRLLYGTHTFNNDLSITGTGQLELAGMVDAASSLTINGALSFTNLYTENRNEILGSGTLTLQKWEYHDGLLNMNTVVNTQRLDVLTSLPGSTLVLQEIRGKGISVKSRLIVNAVSYVAMNNGATITCENTCYATMTFIRTKTGNIDTTGSWINKGYMEFVDNVYVSSVEAPLINTGVIKILLEPGKTDYTDQVVAFYYGTFNGIFDLPTFADAETGRVLFGMKTTFEQGLTFNNTGAVIIDGASLLPLTDIYLETPAVLAQRTKTFTGNVDFKKLVLQPGAILTGKDITTQSLNWNGAMFTNINAVISNNVTVTHDGLSGPKNIVDKSIVTVDGKATFDNSRIQFLNGGQVFLNKTSTSSIVSHNVMFVENYAMNGRMINEGVLTISGSGTTIIGNGILENRGSLKLKPTNVASKNKYEINVVNKLIFTSTSTLYLNLYNKQDGTTFYNDYFVTDSVGEITLGGVLDVTVVPPPTIPGQDTPTFNIAKSDKFTLFVSNYDLLTGTWNTIKGSFTSVATHNLGSFALGQRYNQKPDDMRKVYYSGIEVCDTTDSTCKVTTGSVVDTATPTPSPTQPGTAPPASPTTTAAPTPSKLNSATNIVPSFIMMIVTLVIILQ